MTRTELARFVAQCSGNGMETEEFLVDILSRANLSQGEINSLGKIILNLGRNASIDGYNGTVWNGPVE